jgi:hypothetical protein
MDNRPLHERLDEAGRNMQKVGGKLTLALTVPIAGLVLFGWVGLAIGILIPIVVFTLKKKDV